MRRLIVILTSTILLLSGFAIPTATASYVFGSTGPAGGKIFITPTTTGNTTGLYFEAATEDVSASRFLWCNSSDQSIAGANGTAIGSGRTNTQAMLDHGCISGAGFAASIYTQGGFSDWYLPSSSEVVEAQKLYGIENGLFTGIGLDNQDVHWTSTWVSSTKSYIWYPYISGANLTTSYGLSGGGFYVRAVRSFSLGVPDAPTIGTATALSPTSASISFTAPANNGGATIETYTATSTPGSLTGQVLQSGSGTITITGLTSSTAYTFKVTASNSVGTSSQSSASVSITMPASDEELAEQAAAAAAQREADARAAIAAAEQRREFLKKSARESLVKEFKDSGKMTIETFRQAEIAGITAENIAEVQEEILALSDEMRGDIAQVLKVARKYEVVGIIASDRVSTVYSNSLVEIGLIPQESANTSFLTYLVRKLPESERTNYAQIKAVIDSQMIKIQQRQDRFAAVKARIAAARAA
jgi:hypothetical protein